MRIGIHKLHPDVITPSYATEDSACFDIHAYLKPKFNVRIFNSSESVDVRAVSDDHALLLLKDEIALIPTGIIFNISPCHSIRLHPRSGLSLKEGLILQNCEGVIDSDYVEETFVMIRNTSLATRYIKDGDRICQGEIVEVKQGFFYETEKPKQKTDRSGGFGSTGK